MKLGDNIGGYTVVTPPSNLDAGKCVWAFAEKAGGEYFIKEFLDPKIPKADGMGSVADKKRRHAECERFRARHERVMGMLRADHEYAGNLVLATDFFPHGTRFYKVTPRVAPAEAVPHELPPRTQLVLLRTLADSLRLLHTCGIVHGDLKPENVLLARPRSLLLAKLIDFDDAYPAGEPPPHDLIGGNPLYGAPEWLRYVRAEDVTMTQALDMFAFGLLVHTYLFGALPDHGEHDSPAAAVLDGDRLGWAPLLRGPLRELLTGLTAADPRDRPDIHEASALLATPDLLPEEETRVRVNLGRPTRGRLRINMTRTSEESPPR